MSPVVRDRYRYVIAAMIFSCTFAAYISRVNLTVTIVHMVHRPPALLEAGEASSSLDAISNSDVCPRRSASDSGDHYHYHHQQQNKSSSGDNDSNSHLSEPKYHWDETDQGQILSSFYLLYMSMQVPGGRLVEHFGPRRLCSLALLGTGMINLLLPLVVDHSYSLLIASRILMGGLQATVFSSCYALVGRWIPEEERSTVISLTSIGAAFGSMATSALAGQICTHYTWRLVFQLSGLVITLLGLLYLLLVADDPASSPYVTEAEFLYISDHLPKGSLKGRRKGSCSSTLIYSTSGSSFPWWTVLTSRPLLAVITVKLTMGFVYNLVMLKLPSYLSQVLGMSIAEVGTYSALIFGVKGLSHLVFGIAADSLLRRRAFRCKTRLRKTFQTMAVFGTSQCLLLLSSADCDRPSFLTLILLGMAFLGLQAGGEMVVYADLTTDYAATVFAIAQTVGLVAGFLPHAMGPLLDRSPAHLKETWWAVFKGVALFNVLGGVVFLAGGSAEQQHWEEEGEASMKGGYEREYKKKGLLGQLLGSESNNNDDDDDKISLDMENYKVKKNYTD